jgi:DNA-binding NtrC family response regulator
MKQKPINIFVVEDDIIYSSVLVHFLSLNPDYQVKKFLSAKDVLASIHEKPDIVTLDYSLPDATGDHLLTQIRELSPDTKVIMISGQEDIRVAIDLFKKGAHDYIVKDSDTQEKLWMAIQNLRENIELKKEIESLQKEVEKKYNFSKIIIGTSPAIKKIFTLMEKAASSNITVSITGETGTGKELVAKSIHFNSERKKMPFVPINVAAIPGELLESELFGHEKGSFTGATARRLGKFEEASKGTLFLDEIGEMDINMQAKLLRTLQEKEITRVGSNEIIKINARIIVATHRNLLDEVKRGKFREDLYYRLLGLPIHLPPLRERDNDIILIARNFIEQYCTENQISKKNLSVEAKKKLMMYTYPGNIRELKSVIDLACVLCDDDEINEEHLQLNSYSSSGNSTSAFNLSQENLTLKDYNIRLIQSLLEANDYDVVEVARRLDIGKSTIYRMVKNNELNLIKRPDKPF